ncbi:MAG: hypothetical protein LV479_02460 [Methylacidiphilales bacterium]|nr:hypothetical protein [Candidatus Methylacidiphilales bacterium]
MNTINDQLNRLFRAARATPEGLAMPPFGLETRALAAWRESVLTGAGVPFWSGALLFRGLILAGLVMLVSLWPVINQTSNTDPFAEYFQLADSTVQVDNTP